MPKIICPDCKSILCNTYQLVRQGRGFKYELVNRSVRVCPAGDTIIRRYCEDCALNHLQLISDIYQDSFEDPDYEDK